MALVQALFAAFGLSASAGLNAYIPLLVVALLARYTSWLHLNPPWDTLTHGGVIAALLVLAAVEFFADKIPAVNHFNDLLQTVVRPVAGAVVFAASTNAIGPIHPALALVAGLIVAGSVHTAKAAVVRPAVSATTGGVAHPVVSFVEDVLALVTSVLAVVMPLVLAVLLIGTAWLVGRWWHRRAQTA